MKLSILLEPDFTRDLLGDMCHLYCGQVHLTLIEPIIGRSHGFRLVDPILCNALELLGIEKNTWSENEPFVLNVHTIEEACIRTEWFYARLLEQFNFKVV